MYGTHEYRNIVSQGVKTHDILCTGWVWNTAVWFRLPIQTVGVSPAMYFSQRSGLALDGARYRAKVWIELKSLKVKCMSF